MQPYPEILATLQADGPALTNSTVATSLLNPQAKWTLGAGFFDRVGKRIRVSGFGRLSNVVTTPGTLTLDLRFGATVVCNGGAMQMSTTVNANASIYFELLATLRATGSSANLMFLWRATALNLLTSGTNLATDGVQLGPNTAPAVGSNFDATVTQQVDLFGTFSVNTATTSIQLHDYCLEALN